MARQLITWATSTEDFFGRAGPRAASNLHHVPADTLYHLAHRGSDRGAHVKGFDPSAAFTPWLRSSAAIGSFATPKKAAAQLKAGRPDAQPSGELRRPPPAHTGQSLLWASSSPHGAQTDSLGPVDLASERARRERALATSPSALFDPTDLRPDSAVRDSIHRPHVLLRRGLYHPM
ncbi:hypothetical protein KFE25_002285 [Diacronema lutheri]|uniref:Uncharacterized protein n=1 Tax=Diacronema lutheri TaxID=2081491 RepID=A0A8J5X3T2_DIALT|nr:hypothetical protein KFE25_002285 [Diacronema lutheri]